MSLLRTNYSINSSNGKTNGIVNANERIHKRSELSGTKLEETFKAATNAIQTLPKNGSFQPSNELLLKFYAYFKQATVGTCKIPRPSIFKVIERAKWDSWNSVKNLSREEAMNAYVDEIKNIVETMPHNDTVQKFLEILGPFYEYVDESQRQHQLENKPEEEQEVVVQQKEETKLNDSLYSHLKLENNVQSESDDEDYCDTSDTIQETAQLVKVLKSRINNAGLNGDCEEMQQNGHDYSNGYDDESVIIHRFGGEANTGQTSGFHGNNPASIRPSRPNSNQQFQRSTNQNFNSNLPRIPGANNGGSGGGGDGNYPPSSNDPYLTSNFDANRQILLLLLRLQQDTNNVLTRLTYLEATVMSIQNSLQMNRIESTMQARASNQLQPRQNYSIWKQFFTNIDWRTILIAIISPFVIRLVFLVLRKFKFIIRFKRSAR